MVCNVFDLRRNFQMQELMVKWRNSGDENNAISQLLLLLIRLLIGKINSYKVEFDQSQNTNNREDTAPSRVIRKLRAH